MTKDSHLTFDTFKRWLQLKESDFISEGYENVSADDIWNYFISYSWKHGVPKRYYQVVQQIMRLTPNDYFNYAQLKAQVYDVKDIDELDFSELL